MIYFLFVFYLLIRLFPYSLSSVPIGYDSGFYLYLWHHSLSIPWLKTVFPPFIFYFGKLLNIFISPENYLLSLSFVFALLLFLSVYLYTKNKWTMLLFSVSAIQYRLWWHFYLKNLLALSFVFFYLYFDRRKSKLKYIFPLLIPLIHQPTAIVFFLILVFKKDMKSLFLFILSFIVYYLPNFSLTIMPYLPGISSKMNLALDTFYTPSQALPLMLPYLPLAFFSLKKDRTFSFLFLFTFLTTFFGFFLSHRFFPFLDIFTIILAGYTLEGINNKLIKIFYSLFLITLSLIFIIKTSPPLITKDEFQEIKLLNTTSANSSVLVTSNEYTPWIYGYSNRKSITPGFGEYDIFWSVTDWNNFWDGQDQIELLKKLPQPLYIWSGDKSTHNFYPTGNCFTRFSWHIWQFNCPNVSEK